MSPKGSFAKKFATGITDDVFRVLVQVAQAGHRAHCRLPPMGACTLP
jgi:hypothetical protein